MYSFKCGVVQKCISIRISSSDDLKNDREIVLAAIRNIPDCLKYAQYKLQRDPDFLCMIAK